MTDLHFLGPDGALTGFPKRYELQRLRKPPRAHLDTFVLAASGARDRLWVLDLHYLPHGHAGIVHALKRAAVKDVRILTERISQAHDKPALQRDLRSAWEGAWGAGHPNGKPARISGHLEWRDRLQRETFPYPHDRFVVVDEQLWHFGFAAGGSGDRLCAASGPWSARDKGALDFFEEVWLSVS